MTDDEILEVVKAHKEGKKIQKWSPNEQGGDFYDIHPTNVIWDFITYRYRVAPEPPKRCPQCGRRIADIVALGGTVEHNPPPKPREYWIDSDASNGPWRAYNYVPSYPSGSLNEKCLVHVREVLEDRACNCGFPDQHHSVEHYPYCNSLK